MHWFGSKGSGDILLPGIENDDPPDIDEDNKAGKDIGDSDDTYEEGDDTPECVTAAPCSEVVLTEDERDAADTGLADGWVSTSLSETGTGFIVSFASKFPTVSEATEKFASAVTST